MGWLADILQELPLSAALKSKLEEKEAQYEKLYRDHGNALRELNELQERLAKYEKQQDGDGLSDEERSIITLLAKNGGYLRLQDIAAQLKIHATRAEHFLEELEAKEFVHCAHSYLEPTSYGLASAGKKYAVEVGIV